MTHPHRPPSARRSSPLLALALCAIGAPATAQTVAPPNIGNALKQTQPTPPAPAPQAPAPMIVEQETPALSLPAGETLLVREFRFEGDSLIAADDLQAAVAAYKGRQLSMADIEGAAAKVTALYRSRGYLVARAYVPRQDASAGTLTIHVRIGKFGQFTLANHSLVRDGVLRRSFAGLQAEPAIARASLERAMLLVGDMPGAQMPRLTLSPGQAPGSSDFDVDVGAGQRFGGYALVDNAGSRSTGQTRLSTELRVDSPLGIADRLTLDAMGVGGGGLVNGRLAYSLPVGASGLRAELAGSRTSYDLGGAYSDLDANGQAHTVEGMLSYPLLRSRSHNLNLSLGLAARRLRDHIAASDVLNPRKADVATLTLQDERWGGLLGHDGYADVNLGLSVGDLRLDDAAQKALNQAGARTTGKYARLNLGLAGSLVLGRDWSASASLAVQKALHNKNLDTSEQMSLSGSSGVIAYRESVTGDDGYLFNAGLHYALPALAGISHTLGAFADIGRVRLEDGAYATLTGTQLSDLGLAYEAHRGALSLKLQLAHAVGGLPPTVAQDGRTRLVAQAAAVF